MSSSAASTTPAALTRPQLESWDISHLETAAARWGTSARASEQLFDQHRQNVASPGGTEWHGIAKDAAWDRVATDTAVVAGHSEIVQAAADIAANGADDLRAARRATLEAIAEAEADGFRVGEDLSVVDTRRVYVFTMVARRTAATEHAEYIRWNAEQLFATDTLIGGRLNGKVTELDSITFDGAGGSDKGKVEFVDNQTGDRDAWHPDGHERDPDGEYGRRTRHDDFFRRPEGGDSNGRDYLESDWAGRAILDRYLVGGGRDWTIQDNPEWSQYTMNDDGLARQLDGQVHDQAQQSLTEYLSGKHTDRDYATQFHAETQNGESIVGYQYLNGSNQRAGDFQMAGTTHVQPLADGTYKVTVDGGYKFNDIIDPNFDYSTDTWKNRIVEIVTLRQAEPYQIHIGWHAQSEFIFDQNGSLVSAKGFPYK